MKKNLIITSEFPPLPGGIGNHAYMLSRYLSKEKFEVSVLTDVRSKNQDITFDAAQDFKIFRINRNAFTYINRLVKGIQVAKSNDVIIASGKFSLWLAGMLKFLFPHKKYIAVLHGTELKAGNFFLQKITKFSLSRFNHLIAVSSFTKKVAQEINKKLVIQIIHNGIELPQNEVINKNLSQTLNLVTVGNLTYRKGQHNVIKALPVLKQIFPNIMYHCIGIPTEKNAFSDLAKSLNVVENVTFYGLLSQNEKDTILKECDIFIMLSDIVKNDFEGFGIAILEANAMGIPAIGSKNTGIADAINNKFSGILVNQHNPEEIKNAIITIRDNYSYYSLNAIEWASHFSWEKIIKKYIDTINL